MPDLEAALRARRDAGGRLFIPYVTGGYPGVDASLLRAIQEAGADAIEVGIPFSDPVMDGGVIQEASRLALEAGARPGDILATIAEAALDVPVAVMTYVNPVYRHGFEAFLTDAGRAGVAGIIVPDLPVDEAVEWTAACAGHGIASVQLAAPGTSDDRLALIAKASQRLPVLRGHVRGHRRAGRARRDRPSAHRAAPAAHGPPARGRRGGGHAGAGGRGGDVRGRRGRGHRADGEAARGDREGMLGLVAAFRAALP